MNHTTYYFMNPLFLLKKKTRLSTLLLTLFFAQLSPQISFAEHSVIVHPSNQNQLSSKEVQLIFLGRLKSFPNENKVIAIDQPFNSDLRKSFGVKLLKKSNQQIKSYWARQIFTGKGIPPKELDSAESVKAFVAANKNAIGYINTELLDKSVKEVLVF